MTHIYSAANSRGRPLRSASRGFNLIEISIVLAIIGVVIGGIWWTASKVRENTEANKVIADMHMVMERVSQLIAGHNAGTIGTANADASVLMFFPPDYRAGNGGYIYSPTTKLAWRLTVTGAINGANLTFLYDPDMAQTTPTSRSSMPKGFCTKFLYAYMNGVQNWKAVSSNGTFGFTTDAGASLVAFGPTNIYASWQDTGGQAIQTICGRGLKSVAGTTMTLR